MSKFFDVTIGADPEFCLISESGRVIEADEYGSALEEIGADGNGVTFEVRPAPSTDPLIVVANISKAMNFRASIQPGLLKHKWQAGSLRHKYALGGHIHFGTKRKISGRTGTEILTQFVGPLLALVENEAEARERRMPTRTIYGSRATAYGKAMDFRIQKHGFEYRMPGSWLVSPQMASAALCLAKVVMSEAINNKSLSPKENILASDINLMKTDVLRQKFPVIWHQITQMALYPKYKKELLFLRNLIIKQKDWFHPVETKDDIRAAWGVELTRGLFLGKVTVKDIWGTV